MIATESIAAIAVTLVDIRTTQLSFVTGLTFTFKRVNTIDAPTVDAWVRVAVVNVCFTVITRVSRPTQARVSVY